MDNEKLLYGLATMHQIEMDDEDSEVFDFYMNLDNKFLNNFNNNFVLNRKHK